MWLKKDSPSNLQTHVLETRRKLQQMQTVVAENLQVAQAKEKQLYDSNSSNRRFEVGDKVLVLLPTLGSKLEMKWQGPYTVSKVLDNGDRSRSRSKTEKNLPYKPT